MSVFQDKNYRELIPFITDCASRLADLFPSGSIPCLERQKPAKVTLTRKQVGCLLSHMFLCTILPNKELKQTHSGHFTGDSAPTGPLTFIKWLTRDQYGPTHIYLSSLMLFFKDLKSMSEEQLAETVTFERLVTNTEKRDWTPENSSAPIVEVEVHEDGRIGDIEQVEVDFANQHVGFGTSGTQEELILGTSPETCVIVLFNEVLETNEAVLITGAKRYGDYSGYGNGSRFIGPSSQTWNWNERKILAIDAICWPDRQLSDNTFDRELCKAWTGFQALKGSSISTGNWGCGAFGGNPRIKCLVQVMAASMAGVRKLDFYTFGEKGLSAELKSALQVMKGQTVGWLWERIKEFRSEPDAFALLQYISKYQANKNVDKL